MHAHRSSVVMLFNMNSNMLFLKESRNGVGASRCAEQTLMQWKFLRRSVYRPAFDMQTSLDIASVVPARVVDMEVMHPHVQGSEGAWKVNSDAFEVSGEDPFAGRWMYGFNPYACHELVVSCVCVGAELHWLAINSDETLMLRVGLKRDTENVWKLTVSGRSGDFVLPEASGYWKHDAEAVSGCRVILQGQGCGMTLYCQNGNALPEVVLSIDFPSDFDFRVVQRSQRTQVLVGAVASVAAPVILHSVRQFFSAGVGIADISSVTTPDGTPLIERNRVFVTASLRGRGLPHPLQGVLSFNPVLGDVRLEGVIVFDCADGLWRNEIASNLVFDPESGEWFGLTTGFSSYGDTPPGAKQIWAFRTRQDPRFGFSVIGAKTSGLIGDYEDPSLFFDRKKGLWRLALCIGSAEGYRAALFESERPDSGFKKIAEASGLDATGTQIVNINGCCHVVFGSADRCLYIASYEDLEIKASLCMDLPPWSSETGTRVWPAVIPLPEGSFAPAILVTMDRVNYPGVPQPNWTYGGLYFYHAIER